MGSREVARVVAAAETVELISPEEEAEILEDLRSGQRVLYWIHKLSGRPVESFTPAVIDAVVVMTQHSDVTFATAAKRLINRIPERRLNPFRSVE